MPRTAVKEAPRLEAQLPGLSRSLALGPAQSTPGSVGRHPPCRL